MLLSGHCCKKKRKAATDIVAAERKEPFVLTTCGSFVQFCWHSPLFNSIRFIFATFPGKGEIRKKAKKKNAGFCDREIHFVYLYSFFPLSFLADRKEEAIGEDWASALAIGLFFPSGAANATFCIYERKKRKKTRM